MIHLRNRQEARRADDKQVHEKAPFSSREPDPDPIGAHRHIVLERAAMTVFRRGFMGFIGPQFVLLLAFSWITFFAVPTRFRPHVLVAAGATFYALWSPWTLWLVAALVAVAYTLSGPRTRWLTVTLLVGLLLYFKRPEGAMAGAATPLVDARAGNAWIPLGFSFLAFELMHYAIERGRGKIGSASLVDLAAFALFFPCRVAGPIKRYPAFTASVSLAEASSDNVYHGCLRIVSGLVKKVALADVLARAGPPIVAANTPLLA